MKKITIILSLLFVTSLFAQAQTFQHQMSLRYALIDQSYDLDCFYYNPKEFKLIEPIEKTHFEGNTLTRRFTAQTLTDEMDFTFEIKNIDGIATRVITFENGLVQTKPILDRFDREFYIRYSETDLDFNKDFEPNTIYCSLNFAREKPFSLNSEKTHINVHPHNSYDRFYVLRKRVNPYMSDDSYRNIILLEDYNIKGAFLNLADFLDTKKMPELQKSDFATHLTELQTADIIVSPAGANVYSIESDNIDLTYTGGNFNFCMFNNTREVLLAYLRSNKEGSINLSYDMNEIIAQVNGAISELDLSIIDINLKKTNYLKDILEKERKASRYFGRYFKFYKKKFFEPFGAFYRTITMKFTSKHYSEEVILKGSGTRNIELNFTILNEK